MVGGYFFPFSDLSIKYTPSGMNILGVPIRENKYPGRGTSKKVALSKMSIKMKSMGL